MLSQRVKAALVFTPLVLIMIYFGGWVFNLFFAAVLLTATYEYGDYSQKSTAVPH